MTSQQQSLQALSQIQARRPVVHNLTNLVVMQTTANLLLAVGASPIMAHAKEELKDIISLADALVLNMGTLDEHWRESAKLAQELAQAIPVVFDPVGAGASAYRTQTAKHILQGGVDIIRGNASEIMALVNTTIHSNGVDSSCQNTEEAVTAAKALSIQYGCVVVISGKTDVIVRQEEVAQVYYGTPLFTKVTGMGCSATALIAAFAAVSANKDYFIAAQQAMILLGLAGEIAAEKAKGPGSFYTALLDTLYSLKVAEYAD